jgi:hypothetical protein
MERLLCGRPDCQFLASIQALTKALGVEVQTLDAGLQLMGDEAGVVVAKYQELDAQVKGILAFVEALRVTMRLIYQISFRADIQQHQCIQIIATAFDHSSMFQ